MLHPQVLLLHQLGSLAVCGCVPVCKDPLAYAVHTSLSVTCRSLNYLALPAVVAFIRSIVDIQFANLSFES